MLGREGTGNRWCATCALPGCCDRMLVSCGVWCAVGEQVRDTYEIKDGQNLLAVTTDRQSAFDRILASVPFKGQVRGLNPEP